MGIQKEDDIQRTTPRGLLRYAQYYLDAANCVKQHLPGWDKPNTIPIPPVYFLVGHSIELALKAYLLCKGVNPKDLAGKQYGHNLEKCFKKSVLLDLNKVIVDINETDIAVVEILNILYASHELKYSKIGMKTFPIYTEVSTTANKLIEGVGKVILSLPYGLPHT